jgi:hypothetical protein
VKSRPFQPGDIAIFQNVPNPFSFVNGEECEVLESLREHHIVCINGNQDTMAVYKVMCSFGVVGVLPEQLRHKKSPEESLSVQRQATIGV